MILAKEIMCFVAKLAKDNKSLVQAQAQVTVRSTHRALAGILKVGANIRAMTDLETV